MDWDEVVRIRKEMNIALKKISENATIKDCSHPNKSECVLPIKSAHSLQRQGSLKHLEKTVSGNSFLYCHTEREQNKNYDFLDLKPIGRKSASTFFGFCDYHDTNLFSVIENDPESTDIQSDEHCFLHSYRSFSHSYHRKYEEYKLYTSTDTEVVNLLEKIHGVNGLKMAIKGVEMALKDFEQPKEKLDKLLNDKSYNELDFLCFEFPYRIPVACASVTTPSHFPSNEVFNMSTNSEDKYSNVITTVLPLKDRSVVILAVFKDDENGIKYLDEIEIIKHELLKQKFLSFHIINNSENVYLSPYFYDKKSINGKIEYCNLINFISNQYTPFIKFTNKFPVNYFCLTEAIN